MHFMVSEKIYDYNIQDILSFIAFPRPRKPARNSESKELEVLPDKENEENKKPRPSPSFLLSGLSMPVSRQLYNSVHLFKFCNTKLLLFKY